MELLDQFEENNKVFLSVIMVLSLFFLSFVIFIAVKNRKHEDFQRIDENLKVSNFSVKPTAQSGNREVRICLDVNAPIEARIIIATNDIETTLSSEYQVINNNHKIVFSEKGRKAVDIMYGQSGEVGRNKIYYAWIDNRQKRRVEFKHIADMNLEGFLVYSVAVLNLIIPRKLEMNLDYQSDLYNTSCIIGAAESEKDRYERLREEALAKSAYEAVVNPPPDPKPVHEPSVKEKSSREGKAICK